MSYTVKFLNEEKILNSDLVSSGNRFYFSEIMASVMTGFAGLSLVGNTFNSVTFETTVDSVTARTTSQGSGLSVEALGSAFVLRSGTVNKITFAVNLGDGFFDAIEITDLNLNSSDTFGTILGFLDRSLSGDQRILDGEGLRYFGTDANDIFANGTRGELGETLTLNGSDYLKLAGGNDRFSAQEGDDTLLGESGHDVLFGERGNDSLSGGTGNDRLFGGDGKDLIKGGFGDDFIEGQDGNDKMSGGGGNDRIDGGRGDDFLAGQKGRDHLTGQQGSDTLNGGAGRDTFVFNNTSGRDVITDFRVNRDLLLIDTESTIKTKVLDEGVRVFWGEGSVLLTGVSDAANLDFV